MFSGGTSSPVAVVICVEEARVGDVSVPDLESLFLGPPASVSVIGACHLVVATAGSL
jgi:hypothetical protein